MTAQHAAILESLRTYASIDNEITHHLAKWLGVHSADAGALAEILNAEAKGTPLSPARLAKRISLSSGATTALLNRLETAGYLVRSREHADRRVVTLRSVAAVTEPANDFFLPLARRLDAMMTTYSAAQLAQFEQLLDDINATMTDVVRDIDDLVGPAPTPGSS
ncbi:MAG: MarR family transcriptional regulator [Nakamurella sp.]